jgi:hypothetical protein
MLIKQHDHYRGAPCAGDNKKKVKNNNLHQRKEINTKKTNEIKNSVQM